MTTPSVGLRCDTCRETAFLYRMHGTDDALCAACFVAAYPPAAAFEPRARVKGPIAAGCLRGLRTAAPDRVVHRLLGRPCR